MLFSRHADQKNRPGALTIWTVAGVLALVASPVRAQSVPVDFRTVAPYNPGLSGWEQNGRPGIIGTEIRIPEGRNLRSVTLKMADAFNNAGGGFRVDLFRVVVSNRVTKVAHVCRLSGDENPATAGDYEYTIPRGLAPTGRYILLATVSPGGGRYRWETGPENTSSEARSTFYGLIRTAPVSTGGTGSSGSTSSTGGTVTTGAVLLIGSSSQTSRVLGSSFTIDSGSSSNSGGVTNLTRVFDPARLTHSSGVLTLSNSSQSSSTTGSNISSGLSDGATIGNYTLNYGSTVGHLVLSSQTSIATIFFNPTQLIESDEFFHLVEALLGSGGKLVITGANSTENTTIDASTNLSPESLRALLLVSRTLRLIPADPPSPLSLPTTGSESGTAIGNFIATVATNLGKGNSFTLVNQPASTVPATNPTNPTPTNLGSNLGSGTLRTIDTLTLTVDGIINTSLFLSATEEGYAGSPVNTTLLELFEFPDNAGPLAVKLETIPEVSLLSVQNPAPFAPVPVGASGPTQRLEIRSLAQVAIRGLRVVADARTRRNFRITQPTSRSLEAGGLTEFFVTPAPRKPGIQRGRIFVKGSIGSAIVSVSVRGSSSGSGSAPRSGAHKITGSSSRSR